jgi:DNA-binding beta-propeller fold protein YncE
VSVIEIATNSVVETIPVGDRPYHVAYAPDGSRAVVAAGQNGTGALLVIDATTNTVSKTIPFGGSGTGGGAVEPDGVIAYVPDANLGLLAVDLVTDAVSTVGTVGRWPQEIVLTSDGGLAFVSDFREESVYVFDLTNGATDVVPLGAPLSRIGIGPPR